MLNSVIYFSTINIIITFFNNGRFYIKLALFDNESILINPLNFCNLLLCIYYNKLRLINFYFNKIQFICFFKLILFDLFIFLLSFNNCFFLESNKMMTGPSFKILLFLFDRICSCILCFISIYCKICSMA